MALIRVHVADDGEVWPTLSAYRCVRHADGEHHAPQEVPEEIMKTYERALDALRQAENALLTAAGMNA